MLKIINLHFKINNKSLLDSLSIDIQPGELIAIIGPNGAGKSTFLSALAQEIDAQWEDYSFKNKNISLYSKKEMPLHRGKFSQHQSSEINLKNNEIVLMGRYPYFNHLPNEKDLQIVDYWMHQTETAHLLDREYEQLSGGEKQRLHLARVFAQLDNEVENKLLLLDEPLNNLDITHQFNTLQLIKEFTRKNHTALVVLHDLNIATQFADRLILLNNGKIDSFDTAEKVLTQEKISKVYKYPCNIIHHPKTQQPIIVFG
ncbi:heme ABC transporter ATP-binding protein [Capnocytophaga sp. ARDL2]|uniref:heme ABC transporter ATP-binding protein n=1 Tax=Capnocytophaga sp. ARDL2 TaxID=3238809 RepID=UPI0035562031